MSISTNTDQISLTKGDITKYDIDAIVNAANSSLLGGRRNRRSHSQVWREQILEECLDIRNKQGGCKTGEAVITIGGLLKAKCKRQRMSVFKN
jgi:O-acetyl-ADP-ribose deacetylase